MLPRRHIRGFRRYSRCRKRISGKLIEQRGRRTRPLCKRSQERSESGPSGWDLSSMASPRHRLHMPRIAVLGLVGVKSILGEACEEILLHSW